MIFIINNDDILTGNRFYIGSGEVVSNPWKKKFAIQIKGCKVVYLTFKKESTRDAVFEKIKQMIISKREVIEISDLDCGVSLQ